MNSVHEQQSPTEPPSWTELAIGEIRHFGRGDHGQEFATVLTWFAEQEGAPQ